MWLDEQPPKLLSQWLKNTATPMLATRPNGEILWCNESFEKLCGYSVIEYTGDKGKTWYDITVDRHDLDSDIIMCNAVVEGVRQDYQLTKTYRAKDGKEVKVIIHVMRYPLTGEFQFMLVTVYPYNGESKTIVDSINSIKNKLQDIDHIINNPSPYVSDVEKFLNWLDANPKKAGVLIFFISFLLFGDRVLEVGKAIFEFIK